MSRQARQPHDPLRGTWRAGQAPEVDTPTPAPQQHPEGGYGIESDWMMQSRAVNLVRRAYGIERGDLRRWGPQHDRQALRLYRMMQNNEALPEVFTQQRAAAPMPDPISWITPRHSSR